MSQTIVTKKIAGQSIRIKASCDAKTIYVGWDDALNYEQNHKAACDELCRRMDEASASHVWTKPKVTGFVKGVGYHVFVESSSNGDRFTRESRDILRDGKPFITITRTEVGKHGNYGATPVEADEITRHIVDLLNL